VPFHRHDRFARHARGAHAGRNPGGPFTADRSTLDGSPLVIYSQQHDDRIVGKKHLADVLSRLVQNLANLEGHRFEVPVDARKGGRIERCKQLVLHRGGHMAHVGASWTGRGLIGEPRSTGDRGSAHTRACVRPMISRAGRFAKSAGG
jgi:hypothetical protein